MHDAQCTRYKSATEIDKILAEGNKIKYTKNTLYALRWCFRMPTVNGNSRQLQVWVAIAVVKTLCQIKAQKIKNKVLIVTSNWPTINCIFIAYRKIVKINAILCFNCHCRICDWTAVCRLVSYRYKDISIVHALQLTLQKTRRQWFNCRRKAKRKHALL